jgi:hypothetical protein
MIRRPPNGRIRGVLSGVLLALVALSVLGAVALPVAGTQTATERSATGGDSADTALVVALAEDGDATVTLRLTFDLDREEDRLALERLRANRTEIADGFETRMRVIAERTAERTGREMAVTGADLTVTTGGSTGVVELSVGWAGLAAVEGDRLVVSQPFADGFEPAGRFVVRGPEGYVLAEATPDATNRTDASATWTAGSSLEDFQAAFVPADATSTTLPGFGAPAAVVAVALVAGASALGRRRRS